MDKYLGIKLMHAKPMSRGDYCALRGWRVPVDENPDDAGYLTEDLGAVESNVEGFKGYVSWSPAAVFAKSFAQSHGMDFGTALLAIKRGYKVARKGWNGKGMWLILVPGQKAVQLKEGTPYHAALGPVETEILPHIDMWTVNAEGRRAMLPGWLASQSDMLAEDWEIVE